MTTVGEAFRQGAGGHAQDITVQGRPWSLEASVIAAPVWILHGEADTVVRSPRHATPSSGSRLRSC
jgi:alpha-beta hydrolase superfamily lysophospholipase